MKIGEKIFRQMFQKTRRKPAGFQEGFDQNGGKYSVKICVPELISGYLMQLPLVGVLRADFLIGVGRCVLAGGAVVIAVGIDVLGHVARLVIGIGLDRFRCAVAVFDHGHLFDKMAGLVSVGRGGLAAVFTTTTIAPAVAAVTTMIFTWIKNGKPDVSMTLNASLAGLVAITPTCATVDALGASIIGIVAGIIVVLVVEWLDVKLHIDDPVGAVAVHLANGIWGTLSDGLFNVEEGVFYGGGFHHLGVQFVGEASILVWTTVCMLITFTLIKKLHGLRASREEEIVGLDKLEHGIDSS